MAKPWTIRWTRPMLWCLYVEQRLSTVVIARKMGCSARTVAYQLAQAGIERRGKSDARWCTICAQCGAPRWPRARKALCRTCWHAWVYDHLRRTLR